MGIYCDAPISQDQRFEDLSASVRKTNHKQRGDGFSTLIELQDLELFGTVQKWQIDIQLLS